MPLLYQAIAAFQGNPSAAQFTFAVGDKILVKDAASVNLQSGWGWGKLMADGSVGWFPSSYLTPAVGHQDQGYGVQKAVPNNDSYVPTAVAVPMGTASTATPFHFHSDPEEDLFGGAPMGGTSASSPVTGFGASPIQSQQAGSSSSKTAGTAWPNWKLDGSRLKKAGSSIVSASSTAVNAATPHVQKARSTTNTLLFGSPSNNTSTPHNPPPAATAAANTTVTTSTTTRSGGWFSSNQTTTTVVTKTAPQPQAPPPPPPPPSHGERMAGRISDYAAFRSVWSALDGNTKGAVKGAGLAAAAYAVESNLAANRGNQGN